MKKSVLPALLFVPAAALCQLAAAAEPEPAALAVGSSARGEITTAHRLNYNDGSRSVVYDMDLAAGQAVALETSGALCARLIVLHEGETIAGPSEPQCDSDSSANRSSLSMLAREAGRYRVAVSGTGAQSYGPFRIETRQLQVHRGDGPLQPGADIVDFLQGGTKAYRIDIRQSGYYVIDMRSSELDSALELHGNGISISDDDGGDQLNSRIRVPLEPGSYTLRAKSVDNKSSGMYQLSVATGTLPAGVRLRNSGAIAPDGSTTHGVLAGAPREYELRITRTSRVTIDLRSEDFDTVLELRGNNVSQENDDGGNNTDSRISTVLQPGNYRVIARGLNENASGLFELSATASDLPAGTSLRSGGELALDTTIIGLIDGAQRYELQVTQPGQLLIDMRSDDFDAVLELQHNGTTVAEDDDGGDASNARISAQVQPGSYTVIAKRYGDGRGSGLYELVTRFTAGTAGAAIAE